MKTICKCGHLKNMHVTISDRQGKESRFAGCHPTITTTGYMGDVMSFYICDCKGYEVNKESRRTSQV